VWYSILTIGWTPPPSAIPVRSDRMFYRSRYDRTGFPTDHRISPDRIGSSSNRSSPIPYCTGTFGPDVRPTTRFLRIIRPSANTRYLVLAAGSVTVLCRQTKRDEEATDGRTDSPPFFATPYQVRYQVVYLLVDYLLTNRHRYNISVVL
jgi:hypothetical protein